MKSLHFCFEKDKVMLINQGIEERLWCQGQMCVCGVSLHQTLQRQVPVQSLKLCSQCVITPWCHSGISKMRAGHVISIRRIFINEVWSQCCEHSRAWVLGRETHGLQSSAD